MFDVGRVIASYVMKAGIDTYCFHRFFGEVYPQQKRPERAMALEDLTEFGRSIAVDGVSIESCFLPSVEASYVADPDYGTDEHAAVAASVNELRRLVARLLCKSPASEYRYAVLRIRCAQILSYGLCTHSGTGRQGVK